MDETRAKELLVIGGSALPLVHLFLLHRTSYGLATTLCKPSGINRIYRPYREEGLTVRKRRAHRKAGRTRAPVPVWARPNARWSRTSSTTSSPTASASASSILSKTSPGNDWAPFRTRRSRGSTWPRTDRNRRATRQARNDRVSPWHRVHLQRHARLDQGHSHRLALYRVGKAMQNGFIKSFNCRMRDELLNKTCSSIWMTPAPRSSTRSTTTISGRLTRR